MSDLPPTQTLFSSLQKFTAQNAFPSENLHPFSVGSPSTVALLHELVQTTDDILNSLDATMSLPLSNPKLVINLRQQVANSRTVHQLDQNTSAMIETLRARSGIMYGEDMPSSQMSPQELCISRLELLGKSVGMEVWSDFPDGRVIVVLGGKRLVIDIELSTASSLVQVSTIKTAYAVMNAPNDVPTELSASLEAFLKRCINAYLDMVQRREDPLAAQRLGRVVREHLAYLMMLDGLALEEGGSGVRWFKEMERVAGVAEDVARGEADSAANLLNLTRVPVDIYLLRSHALPLPYLTSPCLSFLVHLSPQAYLGMLRSSPSSNPTDDRTPNIDMPLPHLTTFLEAQRWHGTTLATLCLVTTPPNTHASTEAASHSPRPTFPLLPTSAPSIEYPFPRAPNHTWVLDFERNGTKGVVMAQSRMRVIEDVVGRSMDGGMDVDGMGLGGMAMSAMAGIMFGGRSWVDLLINPGAKQQVSPERYTALYRSPSSAHPPLHLRLTLPPDPGFLLERVPVRSMREVWGVLEVVREQCWLNGLLEGVTWNAEGFDVMSRGLGEREDDKKESAEPTEEELEAILTGSTTPQALPINILLPSSSPPMVLMGCPARPPHESQGLIEIGVRWDEGVHVDLRGGPWGFGLGEGEQEKGFRGRLEEACRRGGIWGIPGRVWNASDAEMGG